MIKLKLPPKRTIRDPLPSGKFAGMLICELPSVYILAADRYDLFTLWGYRGPSTRQNIKKMVRQAEIDLDEGVDLLTWRDFT